MGNAITHVSTSMRRRAIGLRYAFTSGRIASSKCRQARTFESGLERDFYLLLEFDADVQRYDTQPVSLNWCDASGDGGRYTPDVLVHYAPDVRRVPTLYEVKPQAVLKRDWHLFRPRFKAAVKWCRSQGYRFHIIRDIEIRTPFLSNAKFLLGYTDSRLHIGGAEVLRLRQEVLLAALDRAGSATPKQLVSAVSTSTAEAAELIPYVWNLLAHGRIEADLDQPLTMATPLWSPYES